MPEPEPVEDLTGLTEEEIAARIVEREAAKKIKAEKAEALKAKERGNALYAKKDFDAAIAAYDEVLSFSLFFLNESSRRTTSYLCLVCCRVLVSYSISLIKIRNLISFCSCGCMHLEYHTFT